MCKIRDKFVGDIIKEIKLILKYWCNKQKELNNRFDDE